MIYYRNTVSIVYYMLRTLLKSLKLSCNTTTTCTYTGPVQSSRKNISKTRWKKVENSITFIALR